MSSAPRLPVVLPPPAMPTAPVVAIQTPAEARAFVRLHRPEQDHFVGMKRKDRLGIASLLNTSAKARRYEAPLRIQVLQSSLPPALRLQIFEELSHNRCEKYLLWVRRVIALPLNKLHRLPSSADGSVADMVARARTAMDHSITGHKEAKCEVLKLLCQAKTTGGMCQSNYSLGFEGPPGTGKTHFVKTALASALGRPLISIPLGGANDVAYLLGHLYAYEGSKQGRLASALMEAKCCDPIIYFDELDKISSSERATEIVAALIHLVDPTANGALGDRYFHDVDIDYSKCTFVFSYNDPSLVSPVLLDRIKRIPMPAPSNDERDTIIRNHLIPRVQRRFKTKLTFSQRAIDLIVERSCKGGPMGQGMRQAEKEVDHVFAHAHLCQMCGDDTGDIVGAAVTAVLDDEGEVSRCFASEVLPVEESENRLPPDGMYN